MYCSRCISLLLHIIPAAYHSRRAAYITLFLLLMLPVSPNAFFLSHCHHLPHTTARIHLLHDDADGDCGGQGAVISRVVKVLQHFVHGSELVSAAASHARQPLPGCVRGRDPRQ